MPLFFVNNINYIYTKDELLHPFIPGNTEDSAGSHSEFKRKELRADT